MRAPPVLAFSVLLVLGSVAAHADDKAACVEGIAMSRFTAADVYVGSQVIWGLQFGSLPDRPAFADYAARLIERPAYLCAAALDNALIAVAA